MYITQAVLLCRIFKECTGTAREINAASVTQGKGNRIGSSDYGQEIAAGTPMIAHVRQLLVSVCEYQVDGAESGLLEDWHCLSYLVLMTSVGDVRTDLPGPCPANIHFSRYSIGF